MQAGTGEWEILNRARPIPEVLKDPRIDGRTKRLLAEIPEIKAYGEAHGLKATRNYQDYVKLDRPVAVYVVSASEQLAFVSKEWSFPIVGRMPYLGWYNLESARKYARELEAEGWDVDLRGASAYSTLGWFRDPVMSSMISGGDEARGYLVDTVLHESVHATVYIAGQAYFNESLASFVADRLTPVYLREKDGPSEKGDSPELAAFLSSEERGREDEKLMHEAYLALDGIYRGSDPDERKRERKKAVLEPLQQKLGWKRPIGNATLIQYREYNDGTPQFEAVLKACGGDFRRFMQVMGTLRKDSFPSSQANELGPVLGPLEEKCRF